MPSGKTHDFITWLLVPFTFIGGYLVLQDWWLAGIFTLAMLFSGLMFGPDLDIESRQYYRWGYLRFIWWPYKTFFAHRSTFTHGIFLGTIVRLLYLMLVITLSLVITTTLYYWWEQNQVPQLQPIAADLNLWLKGSKQLWRQVDRLMLSVVFVGLCWGAATHSLADWTVTAWKRRRNRRRRRH
jgi:uncharacterized metal-binding protein